MVPQKSGLIVAISGYVGVTYTFGVVFGAAKSAVDRMARGKSFITEGLAPYLAQALRVPENRVRKAAGLPLVPDDQVNITTQPHIWLVTTKKKDDEGEETG